MLPPPVAPTAATQSQPVTQAPWLRSDNERGDGLRRIVRAVPLAYPLLLFTLPDSLRLAIGIAPESALMLLLIASGITLDLSQRRGAGTTRTLASIPITAWCLMAVLLVSRARFASEVGAGPTLRVALWALTFVFAFHTFGSDTASRRLAKLWCATAVAASAVVLLRPSLWEQQEWRLFAFQHRTLMGYFLAPAAAWLLLAATRAGIPSRRRLGYSLAALVTAGLTVTYSRGPWLVFFVAITMFLSSDRRVHRGWVWACVLAALTAAAFGGESTPLGLRLRSIWDLDVDSSSPYRLDLLRAAIRAVPEVGWLGAGPGSAGSLLFQHTTEMYQHIPSARGTAFATDSDLIWLLLEAGPIAASLILLLMTSWALALGKREHWMGREEARRVSTGLFVLAVGLCLLDNTLGTSFGWFILGAGLGIVYRPTRAAGTILRAGPE